MMKSLFRRSKKEQGDDEPEDMDARKSRKSRSRGSAAQDEENPTAGSFSKSKGQLSQAKSEWGVGAFPGDPNTEGPPRIDEDINKAASGPKQVQGQMTAEAKFMAYYQQKQAQNSTSAEPAPAPAPVATLSGDHLAEAAEAFQEDEHQQERERAREKARLEQRKVRESAEQQSKERREALLQSQKASEMSSSAATPKSEPLVEPAGDADELRKQRARQAVEDRKKKAREAVEARKAKAKQAVVNKEREAQGLPPTDNQAEEEEAKGKQEKAEEERSEKEQKEQAARKAEEERVSRKLREDEQFAAELVEKQKLANRKLEEEHARVQAVLVEEERMADEKLRIEQGRAQAALEEEKRMAEEQAFAIKALEELKHQEALEKEKAEEEAFAIKALEELTHQEATEVEKDRLAKVQAAEKERAMFSMEKMAEMMNRGGRPAPEGGMVDGDDHGGDSTSKYSSSDAPPQQQQIDPNNSFAAMPIQQARAASKAQAPPMPRAAPNAQAPPKSQARAPPKMPTGTLNVGKGESYDGVPQDDARSHGDGGSQSGASPHDVSITDGTSQSSEGDLSALLDKEMDDSLDAALQDGLGNSGGSQKIGKSSFAKPDSNPKTKSTVSRRAKSDHPSKPVTGLRFFKPKTTGKSNGPRTRGQPAASAAPEKLAPTPTKPASRKPTPPPVVLASPPKPASTKKATLPPVINSPPRKAAPPKVVSPPKPSRPSSTTSRSAPKPILTTPRQPNRDAFTPTQTPTAVRFGQKAPTTGSETPSSFAKSPANSGRYSRSSMHKSPRHYPTSPARSTFSAMSACSDDGVDHLGRSPHMPLGVDESAGPVCDNPYLAKLHQTRGFCQVCIYHLTDSEKMDFEKNGRHLCVSEAYGGCLDCQVFPPEDEDDAPVRLCRKCFFDTHKLHKAKQEAFGGAGAMTGMVSSSKFKGSPSKIRR
jgi:hypothetical protein